MTTPDQQADSSVVGTSDTPTELIELESGPSKRSSGQGPVLPHYRSVNRWTMNLHKRANEFVLSWENLMYTVKEKPPREAGLKSVCASKHDKVVLKNLSGHIRPGQFLAIIGPSGSGKTSLLNVLAQRIKSDDGKVDGTILVNGEPVRRANFKRVCGYVLQDDILLPFLTVRETLTFSAKLRLPVSYGVDQKLKRVDDVIEELGLSGCENTIIGNDRVRGISGGERKRVNIANELVADPMIIFLDEPTSGLDAFTALSVIQTLDALAQNNYTVICTIHQPRSNIFELFDQLLILADGEAVYFGAAKDAVAYFTSLNYPCPQFFNPPDHFMNLVTVSAGTEDSKSVAQKRVTSLIAAYKNSPMAAAALEVPVAKQSERLYGKGRRRFDLVQFPVLLERSFRNTYRNKNLTLFRLFLDVFIAVVIGLAFLQLNFTQLGVQNRRGVLYIMLIRQMMGTVNLAVAIFPVDRAVFWKERNSGTYGVLVYYVAWQLVTLPFTLFFPTVFSVIVYFMVGLKDTVQNYFIALASIEALNFCAEGLGLAVVCWFPKRLPSQLVSMLIMMSFMLFGGFFLNSGTVPVYLVWLKWLSFVRYGYEAIAVNEFLGRTFTCTNPQQNFTSWLLANNLTASQGVYNTTAQLWVDSANSSIVFNNETLNPCPYMTGAQVLQGLSFSTSSTVILRDILVLLGMALFYRTVAYFGLWFRKPTEEVPQ